MKKTLLSLVAVLTASLASSQDVSNFEQLLSTNSTLDGSEQKLGTSYDAGNAIFPNYFDTAYGGYWRDGWAITSIVDSTTKDYTNLFGNVAGSGYMQSEAYAVGKNNSTIVLADNLSSKAVDGFYLNNTTYAYHTILNGNQFAKPFGGETGNDKDFFVLTVKGYSQGILGADSVNAYLADYRFENNSLDYILDEWTFIDLNSLGIVDSLLFTLTTTDVGSFGPNTPMFFALDNFITHGTVGIEEHANLDVQVYPNPASYFINIQGVEAEKFELISADGRVVKQDIPLGKFDISDLSTGVYLLRSTVHDWTTRIIKQ